MDIFYEVITPQTLAKFKVKSLSYGDELELKGALMVTDASITSHFNSCIFKNAEYIGEDQKIKTQEDFLKNITISDRNSLVAGLHHVTYGDEYITESRCPTCGNLNTNKITVSNYSKVNFYNGKPFEFLNKTKKLNLKISGVTVIIGPVTLYKEQLVLSETEAIEIMPTLANTLMYVREIQSPDITLTVEKDVIKSMNFLKQLPARDVKIIRDEIEKNYGKYLLEIKYKVQCSNKKCNNVYTQFLDFTEQFLRNVIEA